MGSRKPGKILPCSKAFTRREEGKENYQKTIFKRAISDQAKGMIHRNQKQSLYSRSKPSRKRGSGRKGGGPERKNGKKRGGWRTWWGWSSIIEGGNPPRNILGSTNLGGVLGWGENKGKVLAHRFINWTQRRRQVLCSDKKNQKGGWQQGNESTILKGRNSIRECCVSKRGI